MLKQLYNDYEIWKGIRQAKKCRKLHLAPPPICTFEYRVEGIDGKIKTKYRQMTHSYTRNFLNFMCMNSILEPHHSVYTTYSDGSLRLRQTSGSLQSTNNGRVPCINASGSSTSGEHLAAFRGSLNSNAFGIVVGTDDTPESIDDYRMEGLVANGSGAGQLQYQLQVEGTATFNAANKLWNKDWVRSFFNYSGGPITIKEIGCYMYAGTSFQIMCFIRDVLSSPITIDDGEKLTISYDFKYIVSN